MGLMDLGDSSAYLHMRQAKATGDVTVGLLNELVAQQRRTNMLLAALLTPEQAARVESEDRAAMAHIEAEQAGRKRWGRKG